VSLAGTESTRGYKKRLGLCNTVKYSLIFHLLQSLTCSYLDRTVSLVRTKNWSLALILPAPQPDVSWQMHISTSFTSLYLFYGLVLGRNSICCSILHIEQLSRKANLQPKFSSPTTFNYLKAWEHPLLFSKEANSLQGSVIKLSVPWATISFIPLCRKWAKVKNQKLMQFI